MGFLFRRPSTLTVAKSTSDTFGVSIQDTSLIGGIKKTAQDTLGLSLGESLRVGGVRKAVSDILQVGMGETSTSIPRFTRMQITDTLGVRFVDSAHISGPGNLSLYTTSYSVEEYSSLTFQITRGVGDANRVRVSWSISVLEGSPSPASGTVTFNDRDSTPKIVTVNFGAVTANRVGSITLHSPENLDGGAAPTLGISVATLNVLRDTTGPTAPVISVTALSSSSARVELTTPSTASGAPLQYYTLQRSTSANFASNVVTEAQDRASIFPYTSTGLSSGTTYYWRVFAVDASGNNTVSNTVSVTTQGSGPNPINPVLNVSRTSGVAPLAVYVDAIGTTHTSSSIDTWRELGYSFDCGSREERVWAHTGLPKRFWRGGPAGVYVFEEPGIYTIKCSVLDPVSGNWAESSIEVTVLDPNVVFPGQQTICLSRNSDFFGAPAGAMLIPNAAAMPAVQANRRYLFHRDHVFPFGINWNNRSDVSIGAFGDGARPTLTSISFETANLQNNDLTNWSRRVTLSDIYLTGTFSTGNSHSDVLLNRMRAFGGSGATAISFGGTQSHWWLPQHGVPDARRALIEHSVSTFIVECEAANSYYGITGDGRHFCPIGNDISLPVEHCIRMWQSYKSLVAHNRVYGMTDPSKHYIKANGGGDMEWNDLFNLCPNPRTRYLLQKHNVVGTNSGALANWALSIGPQNIQEREGLEDCISEMNEFRRSYGNRVNLAGRRMTARGNFNVNGTSSTDGTGGHAGGLPSSYNGGGPYYINQPMIDIRDPS